MEADLDVAEACRWWAELRPHVPSAVRGLWFGIFSAVRPRGTHVRTMYVVGTADFDASDESAEWAAGEYLWEPAERYLVLPGLAAVPDRPHRLALDHAVDVLREVRPWRDLADVGVAVGYDDGDLVVLHPG